MPENDKNGDGCTVLSGLHLRLFGIDMPFRGCCDEHDLFTNKAEAGATAGLRIGCCASA